MTDTRNEEDGPDDEPASNESQQAPADAPDPFVVLENLQLENAGLKDKLLRAMADMENLRRRTEKEVADAKAYGVAAFARDMLPFADNLHRALANVPADSRAKAEPALQALIEGLELTERDFKSRLERYGVKKFDPNLHEALFEQPDESVPNGTVAQVIEPGYVIGERVLRPAKVGVSRGGPKG